MGYMSVVIAAKRDKKLTNYELFMFEHFPFKSQE